MPSARFIVPVPGKFLVRITYQDIVKDCMIVFNRSTAEM